jgi:hypothetical protein
MIEYDWYEERDEVLRPRHQVKKKKAKKSDHKHQYEIQIRESFIGRGSMEIEICSLCGREGDAKIIWKRREDV